MPRRAALVVDPGAARREAQHILSDGRFRSSDTPRPLRGPLHWLGDRIESVFGALGRLFGSVSGVVWLTVAAFVFVVIVWALVRARRRRARAPTARRAVSNLGSPTAKTPTRWNASADRPNAMATSLARLWLRFRAGLLRLGGRGAIGYRPSVTTGEVRRTLGSPRFDDLAGTFVAVTYGVSIADPPDVDAARRVMAERARRVGLRLVNRRRAWIAVAVVVGGILALNLVAKASTAWSAATNPAARTGLRTLPAPAGLWRPRDPPLSLRPRRRTATRLDRRPRAARRHDGIRHRARRAPGGGGHARGVGHPRRALGDRVARRRSTCTASAPIRRSGSSRALAHRGRPRARQRAARHRRCRERIVVGVRKFNICFWQRIIILHIMGISLFSHFFTTYVV